MSLEPSEADMDRADPTSPKTNRPSMAQTMCLLNHWVKGEAGAVASGEVCASAGETTASVYKTTEDKKVRLRMITPKLRARYQAADFGVKHNHGNLLRLFRTEFRSHASPCVDLDVTLP